MKVSPHTTVKISATSNWLRLLFVKNRLQRGFALESHYEISWGGLSFLIQTVWHIMWTLFGTERQVLHNVGSNFAKIEIYFRFGVTCLAWMKMTCLSIFSRMIKNSLNKEHEWDTVFCYRLLLAFDRISSWRFWCSYHFHYRQSNSI